MSSPTRSGPMFARPPRFAAPWRPRTHQDNAERYAPTPSQRLATHALNALPYRIEHAPWRIGPVAWTRGSRKPPVRLPIEHGAVGRVWGRLNRLAGSAHAGPSLRAIRAHQKRQIAVRS